MGLATLLGRQGTSHRPASAAPFRQADRYRIEGRYEEASRLVIQGLAQRGILVRAGGSLGRAGALRVTVGTEAENERFLDALGALVATPR